MQCVERATTSPVRFWLFNANGVFLQTLTSWILMKTELTSVCLRSNMPFNVLQNESDAGSNFLLFLSAPLY